jgi:hypothetical protein
MKFMVKNRLVYTKTQSFKKIHLSKAGSQYGLNFGIVANLKNKDKTQSDYV